MTFDDRKENIVDNMLNSVLPRRRVQFRGIGQFLVVFW